MKISFLIYKNLISLAYNRLDAPSVNKISLIRQFNTRYNNQTKDTSHTKLTDFQVLIDTSAAESAPYANENWNKNMVYQQKLVNFLMIKPFLR